MATQVSFNSQLEISERLYKDGYHFITNIDFSEVVISDLQERMKGFDDMDYY